MQNIVALDYYPLDRPESRGWTNLVARYRKEIAREGLFNLPGFLRDDACRAALADLTPKLDTEAFTHARKHNIYFKNDIADLAADHPALTQFETVNRTICADQLGDDLIIRLYEWPPLARFLAAVMGKRELFPMKDPLARVNVMAYHTGEALNWHFDRSEFTTTLLLQAPEMGGEFEYVQDLRSDADPNYRGVARLLSGATDEVVRMPVTAGTLNVFRGKNTAHRVSPVAGDTARIISVFSYYDRPDVEFSPEDRIGFYGRPA